MAPFTFALLAILTASLASAGPVAIDNSTLLLNGEMALLFNCQFQNFQKGDTCITGDVACVQGKAATCVDGAWQTQACPRSKSCFALPSIRSNGTFVACTSPNNAASLINSTGVQTNISKNCTSLSDSPFPFSTPNTTDHGDGGQSSCQGGNVTQPTLTLPPTTTTLSPEQASSLISFLSSNGLNSPSSVPGSGPDNVNSLGRNASATPSIILLTSRPISSPTPTPTPTSSSPN